MTVSGRRTEFSRRRLRHLATGSELSGGCVDAGRDVLTAASL